MIFKSKFNPEKAQGDVLGYTPKVIFDIGAYKGDVAHEYRKLYPDSYIHCVEPVKESYGVLIERFKRDNKVYLSNLAIADKRGRSPFYINSSPDTSSFFRTDLRLGEWVNSSLVDSKEVVTVETETIDQYCANANVQKIDILKMDIQGGELLALQGSRSMLSKKAISLIYLEFIIAPIYVGQASFMDICSFLSGFGYALQGLYDLTLAEDRSVKWGNAMFVVGATI